MVLSRPDLEEYPLAQAYSWKAPKGDTGGILYLYPPTSYRERVAAKSKSKKKSQFRYLKQARPHALNPDDLHGIQFRSDGHPHTNKGRTNLGHHRG